MRMSSNMPTTAITAAPAAPVPAARRQQHSLTPPPLPGTSARPTSTPVPLVARLKKTTLKKTARFPAPYAKTPSTANADLTAKLAVALAQSPKRGHRIMRQQASAGIPGSQLMPVRGFAARKPTSSLNLEDWDDAEDNLSAEPVIVASPDWLLNARRERRRTKFRDASSWLLAILITLVITAVAGITLVGGPQNFEPLLQTLSALVAI